MARTRTYYAMKNLGFALLAQGFDSILTFVARTVFIYTLGKIYLGMNGLFSDILILLSLAELGCGTAIIYAMYTPVANDDRQKLSALLNLYKKIYITLGIGMTTVGLLLIPFLNFFISDLPKLKELPLIYVLYLCNTTFSYFFSYKKSILTAYQMHHIVSKITIITVVCQNFLQMSILFLTHNFILYLIIQLAATFLSNMAISIYVDRHYKFLKEYSKERLDKESMHDIVKNIKAMFLDKLSSAVVTSTDNLLISKFVSTIVLGYYSNYTLFVTIIRNIMLRISDALTGSVGNMVSTESPAHARKIFENLLFINFWIISTFSILLFTFINPFISMWIGASYLLQLPVVFITCLNLYMRYIRNTGLIFIDTYGLFKEIRIKCICEAAINLCVSLIFLIPLKLGILGVLLGTFVSNITTNFWFEPYIIYKKKFTVPASSYFFSFFKYFVVSLCTGVVVWFFYHSFTLPTPWLDFVLKFVVSILLINGIYLLLFMRTPQFEYVCVKFKKAGK